MRMFVVLFAFYVVCGSIPAIASAEAVLRDDSLHAVRILVCTTEVEAAEVYRFGLREGAAQAELYIGHRFLECFPQRVNIKATVYFQCIGAIRSSACGELLFRFPDWEGYGIIFPNRPDGQAFDPASP